jgi:hypothetical protein
VTANCVSWNIFPTSLLRFASQLLQLGCDKRLKVLCGSGPMLLKPIAKAIIGHKLTKLTKLSVERFSVDRDVMNHQVCDGMITGLSVHAGNPSNENKISVSLPKTSVTRKLNV